MKRFIALFTIMTLLFSIMIPSGVYAQSSSNIDLSEAIKIAKEKFEFDTKGMDFNQSYNEYDGKQIWSLNWNTNKAPNKSISVSIDADTGDITNMNQWEDNLISSPKIPKYTKEDAIKVAKEFAQKMQPEKFKETKEYEDINVRLYGDTYYGGDTYRISFVRYIKDIPFIDNNIAVSVDKNTLKVRTYDFNWTTTSMPDASKAMSKEEAMKIFKEKLGLELRYNMIYSQKLKKNVPILVYAAKNSVRPIDAITGEVLNYLNYYGDPRLASTKDEQAKEVNGNITPQEQNIIDKSKKYITKEDAVKQAKKYIAIPAEYTQQNANMYVNYTDSNAIWSLNWNYNDQAKNKYGYISVNIDATSGEMTSFYKGGTDIDTPNDKKNIYTKEQAKKLAEEFIGKIQPDLLKQTEYRANPYEYTNPVDKIVIQNFNFLRIVNGIPCLNEGVNASVSLKTGEVTSYNKIWSKVSFPEITKNITLEQAYESLFKNLSFELKYFKYFDYSKSYGNIMPQIKLAYMMEPTYENIDPQTGEILDYNGDPIKLNKDLSFTDVKGHKYENDINTLIQAKILTPNSDKFMPDNKILQKDFIKMLMKSIEPSYYPMASSSDDYDQYYQQAINKRILSSKDKSPEAVITKKDASKMLIRALGVGFVAEMSNLYELTYKDAPQIDKAYIGYIAISSQLKLLEGENEYFNPSRELTKGEFASILVKFLKVDTLPQE